MARLIARLADPAELDAEFNKAFRKAEKENRDGWADIGLPEFHEMSEQRPGEKRFYPRGSIPRPWQAAAKKLATADAIRDGNPPHEAAINAIENRVRSVEIGEPPTYDLLFPEHEPIVIPAKWMISTFSYKRS